MAKENPTRSDYDPTEYWYDKNTDTLYSTTEEGKSYDGNGEERD